MRHLLSIEDLDRAGTERGLDPAAEIRDQAGRPHRLAAGEPARRLFG